jgi:hypothetical protein
MQAMLDTPFSELLPIAENARMHVTRWFGWEVIHETYSRIINQINDDRQR